ncbi:MAG TPA: hypothetical protein IAA60_01450 [Candidatus Ornithomonoglobus intestinigallinarum]|uniref:Uncharacterized protein n=1 Tax=Candidatus Ornithomonoglobus intestinigallinarum TaxID=2840894 RepID=A0A9D1H1I2_9FIRM|nr:hypothetical protein [Candidatus Ornithomonoglobus intestinigallinarum]
MTELEEKIEAAKKLLNENEYIVIPVTKGQMCLCDGCKEQTYLCRYNSIGYTCSNLLCINDFIKEQLDYKTIIANIE